MEAEIEVANGLAGEELVDLLARQEKKIRREESQEFKVIRVEPGVGGWDVGLG